MTEEQKKMIQARHRLEEAQNRDRVRERQAGLIAIFNADDVHTAADLRARMEENKPLMERLAAVRPQHEQSARAKIKELFGKISESDLERAKDAVSLAIGEWQPPKSVTEELGWEDKEPIRKPEQKMPGRKKNKERYDSGR